MASFEALRLIRREHSINRMLSIEEICKLLISVDTMANALDFDAAIYLHKIVDKDVSFGGENFYRDCISALIIQKVPGWAKLITLGRGRFIKKLSNDEFRDIRSLFRQAQLLNQPATNNDIMWWDHVSSHVRLESDRIKLERARKAEELSLYYERQRLIAEGINVEPIWTAVEDNTAGYDVLSYEKGEFGLINKLIEVKSTIASPLRFYLTRNEWEQAMEVGDAYVFHIWNLQPDPPSLHIRKTSDIAPHIPKDNEKGKWKVAEIPIG